MTPHRGNRIWIVLLLPILVGLVGCPFDPKKTGGNDDEPIPSEYKPLITISNVLDNLKLAYEELNYEEYAKLLDEAFRFRFDQRDVGPDMPWQDPEWGVGEELDAHRNMFGGEPNIDDRIVDSITLIFDAGEPEPSLENDEWQQVRLTGVDLSVHTTEQSSGDEWILQTKGGYEAIFHFVLTDEIDAETGANIWKVVMWEDKPPLGKVLLAQE